MEWMSSTYDSFNRSVYIHFNYIKTLRTRLFLYQRLSVECHFKYLAHDHVGTFLYFDQFQIFFYYNLGLYE